MLENLFAHTRDISRKGKYMWNVYTNSSHFIYVVINEFLYFFSSPQVVALSHFRLLVEEVFAPQSHIVGSGVCAGVWVRMKGFFLHFRSSTYTRMYEKYEKSSLVRMSQNPSLLRSRKEKKTPSEHTTLAGGKNNRSFMLFRCRSVAECFPSRAVIVFKWESGMKNIGTMARMVF